MCCCTEQQAARWLDGLAAKALCAHGSQQGVAATAMSGSSRVTDAWHVVDECHIDGVGKNLRWLIASHHPSSSTVCVRKYCLCAFVAACTELHRCNERHVHLCLAKIAYIEMPMYVDALVAAAAVP